MFKKAMFKKANEVSRKNWWLRIPHPRQGLYTRNFNGRNYRFYRSWRPSWRPLYICWKLDSLGCSAPWAPGRGSAPRPHPYGARGALVRMETSRPPPPFLEIWIRHCYSMSGKLTQKFWGKNKKGSDSPPPPPPVHQLLGDAPIKKNVPPPPPPMVWVGLTPCRREPLICRNFFFNAAPKWRCGKKKSFGAPPPPPLTPAYQLFWELRDSWAGGG